MKSLVGVQYFYNIHNAFSSNWKTLIPTSQALIQLTVIRPGVAKAVLQIDLTSTDSLIHSSCSSKYCCLYEPLAEVEQASPLSPLHGISAPPPRLTLPQPPNHCF